MSRNTCMNSACRSFVTNWHMRKSSHWFAPYVRQSGYHDANRLASVQSRSLSVHAADANTDAKRMTSHHRADGKRPRGFREGPIYIPRGVGWERVNQGKPA